MKVRMHTANPSTPSIFAVAIPCQGRRSTTLGMVAAQGQNLKSIIQIAEEEVIP